MAGRWLWRGFNSPNANKIPQQNCNATWNYPLFVGRHDIWAVKVIFPAAANGSIKIQTSITDQDPGLFEPGGGAGTFSGSALAGQATMNGTIETQLLSASFTTWEDLGGAYTVTITAGNPPGSTLLNQQFQGSLYAYNAINIVYTFTSGSGLATICAVLKSTGG